MKTKNQKIIQVQQRPLYKMGYVNQWIVSSNQDHNNNENQVTPNKNMSHKKNTKNQEQLDIIAKTLPLQKQLKGKVLKPMQEAIVNCNLLNDVLVNLPTGFGKSMLYQYPASLLKQMTIIVFVPLRALLWDSIKQAQMHGIDAAQPTNTIIKNYYQKNQLPALMFLTPQKYVKNPATVQQFIYNLYQKNKIFKIVIDQAHCVSQWGSDFRPDYLKIANIKQFYPKIKILAMSATIPIQARNDLIQKAHIQNCFYFQASFNRPNLFYQIIQTSKKDIITEMFDYIKFRGLQDSCGVIYCQTIKLCEEIFSKINEIQPSSALFHSKVSQKQRQQIFDDFKDDKIKMIVSTICFGMGVNKRDIRYVINVGVSSSVQNYYQESGRAGRDGKKSYCLLLTYHGDDSALYFLTDKSQAPKNVKQRKYQKITAMKQYAASDECRKSYLFQQLGQIFKQCNGSCDICATDGQFQSSKKQGKNNGFNFQMRDMTQVAYQLIECLNSNKKHYTKIQLVDYLRDTGKTKANKSVQYAPQFKGYFKNQKKQIVQNLIDQMTKQMLFKIQSKLMMNKFHVKYLKSNPIKKNIPKQQIMVKCPLKQKNPNPIYVPGQKIQNQITKKNFDNYLNMKKTNNENQPFQKPVKNIFNPVTNSQSIDFSDYQDANMVQANVIGPSQDYATQQDQNQSKQSSQILGGDALYQKRKNILIEIYGQEEASKILYQDLQQKNKNNFQKKQVYPVQQQEDPDIEQMIRIARQKAEKQRMTQKRKINKKSIDFL